MKNLQHHKIDTIQPRVHTVEAQQAANDNLIWARRLTWLEIVLYTLLILLVLGIWFKPQQSMLTQIHQAGELIVYTRNTPTTYYEARDERQGFEYDLAKRFADYLGVKLKLIVPEFEDMLPKLAAGQAHIAAAGLTITPEREAFVRFSPPYQEISEQVIYRVGTGKPDDVAELIGKRIGVLKGSTHEQTLLSHQQSLPALRWIAQEGTDSTELLTLLANKELDYIVLDSNEFLINRSYYPGLAVAFNISETQSLAWAYPKRRDPEFTQVLNNFFDLIDRNGELTQLEERYYGHTERFKRVDAVFFLRDVERKLPSYAAMFKDAAATYDIDWRLLAAIGYQESLWDEDAVSPTGVRGLMMLTRRTAGQMKIKNRLDPAASIDGGTRYYQLLKKRLPPTIKEPDRTWMTLAAYNVGFGHLQDAQQLTRKRDGDPDKWVDVKQNLPLLSQKKYYKDLRYGYARGREPVVYVQNIRNYYDLLVWHDQQNQPVLTEPESIEATSVDLLPLSL